MTPAALISGCEVVGRDLRARDQDALLARKGCLAAAVEEVRDVGVFLGLGDVELAPAGRGDGLGQRSAADLRRERDLDRQAASYSVIVTTRRSLGAGSPSGPARSKSANAGSARAWISCRARSARKLAWTMGVAVAELAVNAVDDGRQHELVVLPARVRRLDRRDRARRVLPDAVHDRVVAQLRSGPSACRDPSRSSARRPIAIRASGMGRAEARFETRHELDRGARRRVAAVQQGVDAGPTAHRRGAPARRGRRAADPCAWTPPGPTRLTTCRRPVGLDRAPACIHQRRPLEERAVARSRRRSLGRSWSTGRPAPRFRWPTSELPIWPAGRPTASSGRVAALRAASAPGGPPDRHARGGDGVGVRVACRSRSRRG